MIDNQLFEKQQCNFIGHVCETLSLLSSLMQCNVVMDGKA